MGQLDIHNRALAAIGHDRTIAAIDETSTENTRCLLEWDGARLAVLAAHEWNWLVEETAFIDGAYCTESCETSITSEYVYDRPSDMIRLTAALTRENRKANYRAANQQIYSEESELKFRYLVDEEDPDNWPQLVVDAVVYELASRIALPMTANARIAQTMKQMATFALMQAKEHDAKEMCRAGTAGDRYSRARR